MDITRGSLDEISRPACSSRINHGSRNLSGSLEILTPEPSLSKLDYYKKQTEDDSQEHNDGNGEKCGTKTMKTVEDILEQKTNCSSFQLQIQNTNQVHECILGSVDSDDDCAEEIPSGCSTVNPDELVKVQADCILSSVDSEDDCAEETPSGCSTVNREELVKLQAGTAVVPKLLQQSWEPVNFTKLEDSKERDVDPILQKAIKKMKRLDQILATKQSHEKAIKKQGREMKTKLWEEFQSMSSRSSSLITEEEENTSRFLALTSSLQETPGPSDVAEDEMFISVFQTQIYPESVDGDRILAKQDCLNEDRSSIKKIESTHQKNEVICKKTPSFIKKNIELAKDSGNQIVLLEEEKKRLSELLKDTEDENSELEIIEEELTWLVPGEGYTPAPMEFHHLAEIDAKLELIISNGDLSTVRNSCLTVHQQIYKASQAYANRTLEIVPGDKVLRATKEVRDQQNRLKEIDQQLKNLEETPDVLPCLSEEQLNALLQECKQSQRTANALPMSQGFLLPGCDTPGNAVPDSRNGLLQDAHRVGMLTSQETTGAQEEDRCSKEMMETTDCHLDKALVESRLSEKPITENKLIELAPEGQEEMVWYHSGSKNSFLSMALNRDRPKKPSFLDEPFYCMNLNNELSTDVDIPSIPLPTRGDELKKEDVSEE